MNEFSEKGLRKSRESASLKETFFGEQAPFIAELAQKMAECFANGARLFVMGNGGSASDAEHVAVEFMHPIIEKRPALPAMSLTSGTALLTAISNDEDFSRIYSEQLRLLAQSGDMVLLISTSGKSANLVRAAQLAKDKGLLAIAFCGKDGGRLKELCDYCLTVPSFSIHRIQEIHVTLLHILWDLIHVLRGEDDVL